MKKNFFNDLGVKMEILGFETSHSIESMSWYNPYVDIRVRVYCEEYDFSVCLTINKYVVPDEWVPENIKDYTSNQEIWDIVLKNLWDNIENLNVLNAILPIECAVESSLENYEPCDWEEEPSENDIVKSLLEESGWTTLECNMIYDFKVLKYECAVEGNVINDYITEFEVETNNANKYERN